jgi:hypothetical protein
MGSIHSKTHWLIETVGDVDPAIYGPFGTVESQSDRALVLRASDPEGENGLFWLDVVNGVPQIGAYPGAFFEGVDD